MSAPVSAMIVTATRSLMPGTLFSSVTTGRRGLDHGLDLFGQLGHGAGKLINDL